MKQVFHITSGQKKNAGDQLLSIRVGEKHFGFSITSLAGEELHQLAWYTDAEMQENALREIYLQHPELRDSFHKIQLCYDYSHSVLIPQTHFNEGDARLLLQTTYGINGRDTIITESVPNWQLENAYAVPTEIYEWLRGHFATPHSWHTYTVGLKHVEVTDFEGSLAVDFRPDDFSLLVSRANKLLLAQTYSYSTPGDVIYYLLNACREFSFSQETVRMSLSGLVDKESALYRELYNYFLHIRFREAEWVLPNGDQQYPAHFFTSLNDLALCES